MKPPVNKDENSMADDLTFTVERYVAEVDARTYIKEFCKADYFIEFCRECKNYGHRYGCPPFDFQPLSVIEQFKRVRIIGAKIIPHDLSLPLEAANDLMKPVIDPLNEELLETERALDGMAFGFVGTCPYCGGEPCARIEGKPCRHPEKVRPSLEAFGFDIGKTANDLLGIEMKWSKKGLIPEYLTLVCGVFYEKIPAGI